MTDAPESPITIAWRFATVLVAAILVLGLLNALPQFLGGEPLGVVRYARVEDAEARLGARLYRPAVLPAGWHWPPSRVRLAVGRPDWIEFVFDEQAEGRQPRGGGTDGDALVLCQALGAAPAGSQVAPALLQPGELLQADDISIDGRVARMQRLLLDGGAIVHELWWQEGAKRVMLRGRVPADDLPRLARALLGNR
jgi:hypothetical protein